MCFENKKNEAAVQCEYDSDDSSISSTSNSSTSSAISSSSEPPYEFNKVLMGKVLDAVFYLERLKLYFRDQPYVYDAFMNTMQDFKMGKITTMIVVERVKILLRSKPELLAQFNRFLPLEYQIVIDY